MKIIPPQDWYDVVHRAGEIATLKGHSLNGVALILLGAVQREEYQEEDGGFTLNHNVLVERAFQAIHGDRTIPIPDSG
jgi:hypothetical protein